MAGSALFPLLRIVFECSGLSKKDLESDCAAVLLE